jgi:hypothetical protein
MRTASSRQRVYTCTVFRALVQAVVEIVRVETMLQPQVLHQSMVVGGYSVASGTRLFVVAATRCL